MRSSSFIGEQRGMDLFRKLSALQARHAARPCAAGAADRGRRNSGRPHGLQRQRRIRSRSKGGADRLGRGRADRRPPAGAWRSRSNAPHPNAALLFADFVLSPEGQKLLNDLDRNPASKTQTTLLTKYKYQMVDPIKWIDESAKWEKLWKELFLPVR